MMTCQHIERELSAYLDGELPAAVRAELQAHLDSCERCRQRLAEWERLSRAVAQFPQMEPPPRFVTAVRQKIHSETDRRSWVDMVFRPFWWKVPLEAVALVAVAVGVMFLVQQPAKHEPHTDFKSATESPALAGAPAARAEIEEKKDGATSSRLRQQQAPAAAPEQIPVPSAAPPGPERGGLGRRMARAMSVAEMEDLTQEKKIVVSATAGFESVLLTNANPAQVEQHVQALVNAMQGSVVEAKQDATTTRRIRVRVPASMVAQLKAQLTELRADATPILGLGKRQEAVDALGMEARKSQDEPMTELEIQIVVPATP